MRAQNTVPVAEIDTLKFRHPWRPYQQRVLDEIERHLSDAKLHVVAPPGSGKTSLGLEIFRRIGRPAIILSPTRTIRDQWLRRLRDFLPPGAPPLPDWASHDLDRPQFLTSATYQALHARRHSTVRRPREEVQLELDLQNPPRLPRDRLRSVIRTFRERQIGVLILDEAHHLRHEWWKVLTSILEGLEQPTVVSLTATPPYDVVGLEWSRYVKLCGPVDEEISVPELVRSGTLCPHQDYVWAVLPSEADQSTAEKYETAVSETVAELAADSRLLEAVRQHPWIAGEAPDAGILLERLEVAVALAAYLRECGDPAPATLLEALDYDESWLPGMDLELWQTLVQHYLFGQTWRDSPARQEHRGEIARRLRERGLLWRRVLRLKGSRPLQRTPSLTASKSEACVRIHRLERAKRGEGLRQVVLTDFIRDDSPSQEALGAWPVFRELIAALGPEHRRKVALLTGRMIVVHRDQLERIGRKAKTLSAAPLPVDPEFFEVRSEKAGAPLVGILTRLLEEGELDTLVGTRSLLGEGWDAPSVNSLILASFVGSFMLTNQMRGRAIRSDPRNPDKTASIWHLVAIDPGRRTGREDLYELRRRFETFVGLAVDRPAIESGIERLQLPAIGGVGWLDNWNQTAAQRLTHSNDLKARWEEAIGSPRGRGDGTAWKLQPGIGIPRPPPSRPLRTLPFFFRGTMRYLVAQGLGLLSIALGFVLDGAAKGSWQSGFFWLLAAILTLFSLPPLARALLVWIRHLPVDGSIRQIAWAVGEALMESRLIQASPQGLTIHVDEARGGAFSISLGGGTFFERSLFADCMAEALGPLDNPRYLVTRSADRAWGQREDYHAVPFLLASKKERAELFLRRWRQRVGPGELIYTRSAEGRRILLQAKTRAFSSAFARRVQRQDRWR